jgi:hypothetical protein
MTIIIMRVHHCFGSGGANSQISGGVNNFFGEVPKIILKKFTI